jgi:hypothetical protein
LRRAQRLIHRLKQRTLMRETSKPKACPAMHCCDSFALLLALWRSRIMSGNTAQQTRVATMKAAIYARFSSDKQTNRSIEDQVALCRAVCEHKG